MIIEKIEIMLIIQIMIIKLISIIWMNGSDT